ncbi:MAG: prepilin-type N-terminal cleavage/methylation domain-containing protein [Roseiarcus sp.]
MRDEDGFTLIEVVAVLAIVALMAAMVLPTLRPGTTPAEVDAYAVRIASLLKADRLASIRSGAPVVTLLSARDGAVRSGYGDNLVEVPADVAFDAVLAERCAGHVIGAGIVFFPSGLSCGGAVALARPGLHVEIRVNWLTGGVEIVTTAKS